MRTTGRAPRGVFQGSNFMTPDVLNYFTGRYAGAVAHVELSEGRGITGAPIYGVTVRGAKGATFTPDPSCLKHSKQAALHYIYDLEAR